MKPVIFFFFLTVAAPAWPQVVTTWQQKKIYYENYRTPYRANFYMPSRYPYPVETNDDTVTTARNDTIYVALDADRNDGVFSIPQGMIIMFQEDYFLKSVFVEIDVAYSASGAEWTREHNFLKKNWRNVGRFFPGLQPGKMLRIKRESLPYNCARIIIKLLASKGESRRYKITVLAEHVVRCK